MGGELFLKTLHHERLTADSASTLQRYWGVIEMHKYFFLLNRSLFAAML